MKVVLGKAAFMGMSAAIGALSVCLLGTILEKRNLQKKVDLFGKFMEELSEKTKK